MTDLTIKKAQKIVAGFVKKRNWDKQPLAIDISFMTEELGEVAREVLALNVERKENKSKKEALESLKEELADLLYWTLKVSSRFDFDLGKAFLKKMEKNKARCFVKKSK